ncbi:acyl-CoA dehydrogenase family protein [Nocardiopsis trehalosi]|uniref:acyl-CoA dehydrogenase family protein n=1 Tax=Nocardiopsis trehalosi TaxID=109329 RepID=UPI0008371FAC|nr:acyl-CoA dehydrogenase family protein [Nocardiopsis trehalosi]
MDFDLTPGQRERRDRTRAAARAALGGTPPRTARDHVTRQDWTAAAELGLVGACLPADAGGGGLGCLDTALLLEDAGWAATDAGLPFAVAAHLLACAVPVRDFAREPARGPLLEGLATGALVAGNAATEDGAGSDVTAMAATARRDGDAYVLDGAKSFVSNAPIADVYVAYAVTDPDAGFLGLTAFAVPADLPGITVGPVLDKIGLHGCAAARVTFAGCRVPAARRLGAEGQGGAVFQHSMAWERAALPAIYLGAMEEQLDRCLAHARTRRQFGRPIGAFQAVSHRLSAMRQRLEAARLLLYRACWLLDRDRAEATTAGALAKTAVAEAAVANGIDAVQVLGALGCLAGGGVEQRLRDAVPALVFSGTGDVQREIVARESGL